MTGDPLRLLQAGDRLDGIPATAWNEFVNAARYVRSMQATGGVPGTGTALAAGQGLIHNATADDRDQFDVLQIDVPIVTPDDNQPEFAARVALSCVAPTSDSGGAFVVLAEPIGSGQIGRAWIDGVCPAWINGGGAFADTKSGECGYLQAGDVGHARILWSDAGEDERWAYVRLADPTNFVLVKTIAGPDATAYPIEADNPTTYYVEILGGTSFTKTPGAGALTYTLSGRHDYAFNLVSDHYIEEGSIVGCFLLNGQLYTMDKLRQQEFLVVCHCRCLTVVGNSGSLSRIDQMTGAVIWTLDFADDAVGQPREACAATVSPDGYVYALVKSVKHAVSSGISLSRSFVDMSHVFYFGAAGTTVGAVYKINSAGTVVGSLELPEMHANCMSGMLEKNIVLACGSICADPNDRNRIYVGADFDVNGNWLHRIDKNMNLVWSFGPTFAVSGDVVKRKIGRTLVTHVTQDGNVFAYNDREGEGTIASDEWAGSGVGDGVYKVSADGNLLSKVGAISQTMPIAAIDHPVEVNTPLFAIYRTNVALEVAYCLGSEFTGTPGYFLALHPSLTLQLPTSVSGAVKLNDFATDFAVTNYHYNVLDVDHSFGEVLDFANYSKGFTVSSQNIGMHFRDGIPYRFIDKSSLFSPIIRFFSYPMMIWNFSTWDISPESVPWSADNGFQGPLSPAGGHLTVYAVCSDVLSDASFTVGVSGLSVNVSRVSPSDPTVIGSPVWREQITETGQTDIVWPWHVAARTIRA